MTVTRSPFRTKRPPPCRIGLRHTASTPLAAGLLYAPPGRRRYVLVLRTRTENPKARGHRPR